ncbi:MAG: aminotransferase class I/II-fold pyridoxal phosphate-dependent enzyme [Gammaproteobacteria bacterium]|jgi:aspartate/methionine/tyrosine aminotransferase
MFANRTKEISPFVVMQLLQRAEEYERSGKTVVHLEVGEPDFQTAEPIVKAAHSAIDAGRTKYTSAPGIAELRQRISTYYQSMGVSISPNRIMVTSGASGGLALLAGLLLNPSDRLLITDPGYPCNDVFARLVGALPKAIPVSADHRFQPTLASFRSAWCDQTRGALLASPSNPTGTMLGAQDLADMAAYAQSRQGFLILDEIYQGLHHKEPEYVSGLAVTDDLYVLNSFSKFFGMTGWRLGWVVVPEQAVEPITALAQNLFISPSAPAQYAALAAFDDDAMAIHKARQQAFVSRAQLLSRGLETLGFKIPVVPDGAFYLYVDISHTGMNSTDFCWRLIDEYQVAVTPGADFGTHQADNHVRFAYTTDERSIAVGLERIDDALRVWGVTK